MFDINNFNIIQDDEYYYVFRSLEAGDISDIENGITNVMRTDRERYKRTPKYSEDSNISLEEMFDHIKIHYRLDTNCISFTTNAGVAIMYGRDKDTYKDTNFNDKYVMLKIPKNELGTISHFAPDYMISEISKLIDEYYEHLDGLDKYEFDRITNCTTQEQLDSITKSLEGEEIFEGGLEFGNTNSKSYTTLSNRQNLEKNKLIAKIDLIPYNLVSNVSNKFLIQTIGSAFASMEVTHYKSIDNNYLMDCPNNIIDIFSILQQSNNPKVSEIENIIIDKLSKGELGNLEEFKYYNYELTEDDLSIDSLYTMSDNGKVDYNEMKNLYIKTFYLAKSKLRVQHSINLLKQVLGNSYDDDVLNELSSTYGIEPEITNKQSKEKIVISDSIGLEYSTELEKNLLNLLTDNYSNQLEYLIDNKEDCIAIAMLDLLDEHKSTSKEDYYANAIIDTFDWKQFNITSIALRHRNNLVNKLKESNFMSVYDELKNEYSAKDVSRILLANIINGNNEIDKDSTFTIEQLEDYLGYYKVKDKDIKLTRYQADAIRNMKKSYKYHRYTNVILPTGTGKSYVAITEMLEYLNTGKKVLYLAPDVEILNQIRYYLVSEVIGDSFNGDLDKIVKEKYPNLVLQTYSYLATGTNSQDIINDKYDFIVTDELHRTGAPEWKSQIEALYNSQDENCKMLGITATPTRDCDGVDMAEYWARFFGYTNEEIYANHHLAYNMDYNQAIALGYLANPRVINCEYEFLRDFESQVQSIKNEEEREKILARLRKDLSKAKGVPEILRENVLPGDACLVFCPMINEDEETGKRITGEQVIEKYQRKLEEIYGKDKINCYSMLSSYTNKENQRQLDSFQNASSDKINFMIVLNKMNEGKHGKYNKLIWFRSLDDNSFVLCSQQLGRISRLLKPGEQIREDERPLAIDLTNNLLRIQGTNEIKKSVDSDDISKFRLVINWIKEYNKIPDINSKDYVESSMASVLKIIIFKYHNKVKDIESINNYKKKIQTLEIKRLSEEIEINIWDLNLPKRNIETKKRRQVPYYLQANPLYRDYSNIMNDLSVEDRINEIYAIYENTGVIPTQKSKEKFSNGTFIGTWINNHRNKIKKIANQGNEKAQKIVELFRWNIDFTDEDRINELYEIYIKTGQIPTQKSKEKFSNDTFMGQWIQNHREKIKIIANQGNEKAQKIVEALGWNIDFTDENRINELYEIYIKTGKMPNSQCKDKFSNGAMIGTWLSRKKNKDIITIIASQGNEKAKKIVEELGLNNVFTDEDRINEIYEVYEKTGIMPNTHSTEKFSNGAMIGYWLHNSSIHQLLVDLANKGNEKAKTIVEQLGWNRVFTDEDRINEIYAIYEQTGKISNSLCKERFSNGTVIGNWLKKKDNQDKIKELANQENEKAKIIAEILGFNEDTIELSLEDRVKELVDYYRKTGTIPSGCSKEKFSNGVLIGNWLNVNNKEKIIELANQGNEDAKIIVDQVFSAKENPKIMALQLINEIEELYIKTGIIPNSTSDYTFKNGTKMGSWISRNKTIIKKIADEGNKMSKIIIDQLGETKSLLSLEDKIDEIYDIYLKTGKIPERRTKLLFSSGTAISSCYSNQKKGIIEAAKNGNKKAQLIVEQLGFDVIKNTLSIHEKMNELVQIFYKTGKMPTTISKESFSDGSFIANFLSNNKDKIIKLAENNDENALIIVSNLHWIGKLTFEQHIDEMYDLYIKTGVAPNTRCKERFSDGCLIGNWINNAGRKNKIIELANQGNEKAQELIENLGWNSNFTNEDRINEIYEIYLKTGKMPNSNFKERFSNNSVIGDWITKHKNDIIKMAQQGNEKAQIIIGKSRSDLTIEDRIDELYEIYEKTGEIPNQQSKEEFSNGILIGTWLRNKKEQIIILANQGNEKAQEIIKVIGWNFTDEDRIDEIYAIYELTGMMPTTSSDETFSIGGKMGLWIYRHKELMMKYAKNGNKKAQTIIRNLDMFKDSIKSIKIDNIDIQKIESTSLKVQEVPVEASIVKEDDNKKIK